MIAVDAEKVRYWLEKGAMPTDTVRSLLKKAGVLAARAVPLKPVRRVGASVAEEAAYPGWRASISRTG